MTWKNSERLERNVYISDILTCGILLFSIISLQVHVLRCPVKDKNDENMLPCWEASCSFIDTAVSESGCVLVFLHGRSRSASVVLAYLMKERGMDFESSWRYLRSKCWHLIDRSLIYEEQLHRWWKRLHSLSLTE